MRSAGQLREMADITRKSWIPVAATLGVTYALVGIVFALPAAHAQLWRLAAWVVSAVAYAAHICYERFRLENSHRRTALHVASAAALGAFWPCCQRQHSRPEHRITRPPPASAPALARALATDHRCAGVLRRTRCKLGSDTHRPAPERDSRRLAAFLTSEVKEKNCKIIEGKIMGRDSITH